MWVLPVHNHISYNFIIFFTFSKFAHPGGGVTARTAIYLIFLQYCNFNIWVKALCSSKPERIEVRVRPAHGENIGRIELKGKGKYYPANLGHGFSSGIYCKGFFSFVKFMTPEKSDSADELIR